jgi:serine/tyrosine/threonine adenylyltransferase
MTTTNAPALMFDNRFVAELPGDAGDATRPRQVTGAAWSHATPTPVKAPRVLAHSREVARMLGFSEDDLRAPWFAEVFAGNRVLPGMQPYAACYGGHQFGNWAGQLGDGRAISLAEVITPSGARQELQLKGAGKTPYSRRADGRAVLRSSIREFLCSEAMHHLGVPTTRALSLVGTGDDVERDMLYDGHPRMEPGAIVCRVAPSFVRFGNFEILAARGDRALLERLVDFTISRDFPELASIVDVVERRERFFREVCERTATLMAHWMRVGFVHGVMNTDNMSILGLTIDYGPYGWVDDFDVEWTPNTTDAHGRRYRFGQQPEVALWNLERLASALLPLFDNDAPLVRGLEAYAARYNEASTRMTADKLGLERINDDDAPLVTHGFALLQQAGMDMTHFFRALATVDVDDPNVERFRDAFYTDASWVQHEPALASWLATWCNRVRREDTDARRARMNAANPCFVLRNYLAQQAIDACESGDASLVHTLLDVLRRPYDEQLDRPDRARYLGKRPDWARNKPGCSMLSCSS